jgi:hypothetical protein
LGQVEDVPRSSTRTTVIPACSALSARADCPADDHGGGFVLGLGHPAPVPRLDPALAAAVLAPAPRSALTRLGSAAGSRPAAGLGVVVVLAVLSADRPPRHQQTLRIPPGDRIRVDDPQVHPGDPAGIGFLPGRVGGDRHFRGHLHPQPPRVEQQGDRTDPLGRLRHVAVQAERAVIPAHRHHPPPAAASAAGGAGTAP